jgi:hypothetical protein
VAHPASLAWSPNHEFDPAERDHLADEFGVEEEDIAAERLPDAGAEAAHPAPPE